MSDKYILVGQTAVPCDDVLEWGRWFEDAERRVAETWLPDEKQPQHRVSTVFLGLDHNFARVGGGPGEPLIFETMVFCQNHRCELDNEMDRYSTWLEAEAGHAAMVERVKTLREFAP